MSNSTKLLVIVVMTPLVWWLLTWLWGCFAPDLGLPVLGYWDIAALDAFLSFVYPTAARWISPHKVEIERGDQ